MKGWLGKEVKSMRTQTGMLPKRLLKQSHFPGRGTQGHQSWFHATVRQHAEEHAGHPKLRNNQEAEDCVHRNRATEVKVSYRECFNDLSYKHGLATWCCFRTSRGEAEKSESGNIFL